MRYAGLCLRPGERRGVRMRGALPRTPLKPFLKEGLKDPKNFYTGSKIDRG